MAKKTKNKKQNKRTGVFCLRKKESKWNSRS